MSMRTIHYVLVFCNFVLGLAVMVVGLCLIMSAILISEGDFEEVEVAIDLTSLAALLSVAGAGVFVFALIGCFGALRGSHLMICMYAAMLLAVLLAKLSVALYVQNNWEYLTTDMEQHMEVAYNQYTQDPDQAMKIDKLQDRMSCCGSTSTSEPWQTLQIPAPGSCFSPYYDKEQYSVACVPKLINGLQEALSDKRLLDDWSVLSLITLAQNTMIVAFLAAVCLCLYPTLKSHQDPDNQKFKLLSTT